MRPGTPAAAPTANGLGSGAQPRESLLGAKRRPRNPRGTSPGSAPGARGWGGSAALGICVACGRETREAESERGRRHPADAFKAPRISARASGVSALVWKMCS